MGSRDRIGASPIDVRNAPTTQPDLKPRKLRAKPEALAARGKPVSENHGTGDVQREIGDRIANAATALVLLEHATRLAIDAKEALRRVVGTEHHAYRDADKAAHAAAVARAVAFEVRRRLG